MFIPNKFLIEPKDNKQYNNTKQTEDGELIVSTSIEEACDVNRIAKVIAVPKLHKTNVRVGDEVVVWHNIFRIIYDNNGVPTNSSYYIKDNLYFADVDLVYMIIRNGEKIAINENCFVEPITDVVNEITNEEQKHLGILKYPSENLIKQGYKQGDKVAFRKNCEYKFKIDDELLYMMNENRILAKL